MVDLATVERAPAPVMSAEEALLLKQTNDLFYYAAFVARVADAEDGEVILNRSVEHAAIIIENLFRKAESTVEILTGELDKSVYGTEAVIAAALKFLSRKQDARIRVLSEGRPIEEHPLLAAINAAGFGDRIALTIIPKPFQARYRCHFAVADGRHLRFEQSREKLEAIVQFNGRELGARLHALFQEYSRELKAA